jgi:ATP-dependent DNA helicase DinG
MATCLEKEGLAVALLKGKSNYGCRMKAIDIPDPDARDKFIEWLDKSEYGDGTDLPGKRPRWWYDVTAEDCVGTACKWVNKCGYWKAKQEAKVAQIVIANHHVVAFDLRFGPFKLLPQYDVLVIDEAHQAPSAFRGAFALTVGPFGASRIIKAIDKTGMNTGFEKRLEEVWKEMFESIKTLDGEIPKDPFGAHGDEAMEILQEMNKMATKEANEAGGFNSANPGYEDEEETEHKSNWKELAEFKQLKNTLQRNLETLRAVKEPDDNTCVYITSNGDKKWKAVNVAPISVGPMIGPKIAQIPTTVITSATISVNGSFDDIKKQLGMDYGTPPAPGSNAALVAKAAGITLPKPVETLVLESPFDYRKQAVLYTPRHLPMPESAGGDPIKRDKYTTAMATEIAKLVKAADGNAFILFSATSDLVEIHAKMLEEDLKGITLITQDDDAESTLKEFHRTPRSVILGLKSFWEGVDVVGDKLRLVVITKLPFPQQGDPVLQARLRQEKKYAMDRGLSEADANFLTFRTIQTPAMITDLRQGVGRLIRSTTDKGVCAILDSRIWTGNGKRLPTPTQTRFEGYGEAAVKSLGFGTKTATFDLVANFLRTNFPDRSAA